MGLGWQAPRGRVGWVRWAVGVVLEDAGRRAWRLLRRVW